MKTHSLIAALALAVTTLCSAAADQNDPPAAASSSAATELDKLREEFERKRADALRPVLSWYRDRLEALEQEAAAAHRDEERRIAAARESASQLFWEEDQPKLKRALLHAGWIWRSDIDREGVPVAFTSDGKVEHVGLRGAWKITGPSEVTVTPDDDAPYVLHFNTSLSLFRADRRSVTGSR